MCTFASFNLAPISFHLWFVGWLVVLPCHYVVPTMIPFSFRLLGFLWAYHVLFLPSTHVTQYFCWISSHIMLGFLGPFYSFGYPRPISFLGASLAHLTLSYFLHSYGFLLKYFRLPWSNYHILYFWVYWPLNHPHLLILFFGFFRPIFACFLLLMIPMVLLLPFLGFLWAHLFFLGSFYYFVDLGTIIPVIRV